MSEPSQPTSAASEAARHIAEHFGRINSGLELVERAMRDQLGSESEVIAQLGEHVISSGGKRLRPALVMLCAELCGYTGPRRIQLAAALELIHTATLLHDDVVDFADLRRGRPSANAIWGNRRAVLAGDFFYARASQVIVDDGSPEILEIFTRAIRLMAEGELLQMQKSFDAGITQNHYYQVIERKSATLLSASCEIGAVLGGVTRGEVGQLSKYGRELGLAFQLRDDVLDYAASAAELGKPPCADLREGKVTLPLLLTLKRCTSSEHELVQGILKSAAHLADAGPEDDRDTGEADAASEALDIASVLELVRRYRGIEDSMRKAEEHAQSADAAIAAFQDCEAKTALLDASAYAVFRDH
jgi:octaprenyl-diphosphate synthase